MAYRLLKHKFSALPGRINIARYHDYVRVAVPGSLLSDFLVYECINLQRRWYCKNTSRLTQGYWSRQFSRKQVVSGHSFNLSFHHSSLANRHQEDFYSFATLSLNPEELQLGLKKFHGIDWDPSLVGEQLSTQVVYVGLYDGFVIHPPFLYQFVFDL